MSWFPLLALVSLLSVSLAVINKSDHPCPSACRCDPALLKATCSGLGLDTAPKKLPSSLQHLDLSNNSIRNTDFITLPHLLTLNLSSNLISQWQFIQNITVPRLISLDLQHNRLDTLTEEAFSSLPQMREIHLQHNKLNTVALSALNNATNLRYVDLSYNVIIRLFSELNSQSDTNNLSRVETLDLSHNMLNELSQWEWFSLLEVGLLNLSFNSLTNIPSASFHDTLTVVSQLSHNDTTPSSQTAADRASSSYANETYMSLYSIGDNTDARNRNIETLDLSHNNLQTVHDGAFQHLYRLTKLHLNANRISVLLPKWFEDLHQLQELDLDANPTVTIPKRTFVSCSQLQYLSLSQMPNLTHIHFDAFAGLKSLQHLSISRNVLLVYLHASTFTPLQSLRVIDISYSGIDTVFPDLLANVSTLETIYMEGNPLRCGCDSKWIYEWIIQFNNTMPKFHSPENIECASPIEVENVAITDLTGFNFSCTPAQITNFTSYDNAMFKVGSPAVIDCVSSGDPQPRTTWITPHGHKVLHHPAYIDWLRPGPHHHTFHANHPWHEGDQYNHDVPHSERIYVLNNGSLYVDYMLRNDAGAYTCKVQNPSGNETLVIHVRLDYSMLKYNVYISVAVGFACAIAFFCIAVVTAVLRYIAYFCSEEQRQKRKSISEILASLDQYRHEKIDRFSAFKSEKFDRLSAYKTEKIDRLSAYKSEKFDKISAYKTEKFDKLSAFKSAKFDQLAQYKMAKVDKLRSYKNLSFSTLVHYIKGMREYYIAQMVKIKENCTQQSEKLRDSYTMRACAFKDYRSHKFDSLRENYAMQVMKIKEYGSSQMTKLREQYRYQQSHIYKLIELMDIGNCMHIVEAECMRTESMLFDPDELNFDFDTHPVHVPYFGEDGDNESNYETAGSNVDLSVAANKKVNASLEQLENERNNLEELNVAHLQQKKAARSSEPRQHKHRKQRRCRHKRPTTLPSFDDQDEDDTKQTPKKKRRKLKEKRPTFHFYDDETTAPDTPPEFRLSAVCATIHNERAPQSSEYDTASANLHSRDTTPEVQGTSTPITPVAGQADVGSGQNVIDLNQPQSPPSEGDEDITPVHRPISALSSPSTPTLTEDHVITVDNGRDNNRTETASTRSLDMESSV